MRWLILLVIVVIVALLLKNQFESGDSMLPKSIPAPTAASPPPAPVAAPANPAPNPLPRNPPPPAGPPNSGPAIQNHYAQLAAIAQRMGMHLSAYRPTPDGAQINIDWATDNAAQSGDFIEAAQREGAIRDFDTSVKLKTFNQDGRRVFSATYLVKF